MFIFYIVSIKNSLHKFGFDIQMMNTHDKDDNEINRDLSQIYKNIINKNYILIVVYIV